MTSEQFILKCRNNLAEIITAKYNPSISYLAGDFHLIWFNKTLNNFKACFCDLRPNERYYECTYDGDSKKIYIDIYEKTDNKTINI